MEEGPERKRVTGKGRETGRESKDLGSSSCFPLLVAFVLVGQRQDVRR